MSLEVELNKKAGRVCPQAINGEIRCPLIVRQTSEDVVTGTVFGYLRMIRPHLWLGPLLNQALQTTRFRQLFYRDLSIRFWERQTRFPPELLGFREGRTEVDLVMEWKNEPTTVWVEAKLWSDLAAGTTHREDNDQVRRGVRTLLAATGQLQSNRLFQLPKRRPIWLGLLVDKPHPLIESCRAGGLHEGLCRGNKVELQANDVIGTATWGDIADVIQRNRPWMSYTEQALAERLAAYLGVKLATPNRDIAPLQTCPATPDKISA